MITYYAISGIWKDNANVITHYAIHSLNLNDKTVGFAEKKSKPEAIRLLSSNYNIAKTILWNYKTQCWDLGSSIEIVGTQFNKYLRSNHDETERNNLSHLIDYGFVTDSFLNHS